MPPDPKSTDLPPDAADSAAHRDRVAEVFYREHPRLLKWLHSKADPEDARDILSTAFTRTLEQRPASVSKLAAYVHRTVRNLLFNYYRDKAVRRRKSVLLRPEESLIAPSPEPRLIEQQRNEVLQRQLESLEPRPRLALQLRLYRGLSNEEIVAYFAEKGIEITERTLQRDLHESYVRCRQAIKTSEELPKKERGE